MSRMLDRLLDGGEPSGEDAMNLGALETCRVDGQRHFRGEPCPVCERRGISDPPTWAGPFPITDELLEKRPVPAIEDPLKLLRAFCDLAMALPQPPRWDMDWYRWRALRGLAHWGRAVLKDEAGALAA